MRIFTGFSKKRDGTANHYSAAATEEAMRKMRFPPVRVKEIKEAKELYLQVPRNMVLIFHSNSERGR
jgi:hypothetical protein